jgi:hypothetical protein
MMRITLACLFGKESPLNINHLSICLNSANMVLYISSGLHVGFAVCGMGVKSVRELFPLGELQDLTVKCFPVALNQVS